MRPIFYSLVFLFLSCGIKPKQRSAPIDQFKVTAENNKWYKDKFGNEVKVDSFLLKRYAWHFSRMEEQRKTNILYAKTNMELVRVSPSRNRFRTFKYTKLNARVNQDTIVLLFNFSYHQESVTYFEQKLLQINIWDDKYSAKIIHSSDVITSKKVGDKYVRIPFPETKLTKNQLILNQSKFTVGDTIKGQFFGRSEIDDNNWEELTQGNFRVIVE